MQPSACAMPLDVLPEWAALASGAGPAHDGSMHPDPHEELTAAIAAERAAWNRVKDRLPGTPGFDPVQWNGWQVAVQRCRAARQAVDDAAALHRASSAGPGGGS